MSAVRGRSEHLSQPSDPLAPRRIGCAADRGGYPGEKSFRDLRRRFRQHSGIEEGEAGRMHADVPRKKGVLLTLACRPHLAESADLGEQAGSIGPFPRRPAILPQSSPLENRVEVARVDDEGLPFPLQKREEPIPRDAEQRTQQSAIRELADRGHPGEPIRAAVSPAADQICLDLIIPVVSGQQMQTTVLAAPTAKQPITREAGRVLDPASRLFPCPDEDLVTNASRRQPGSEPPDLFAALRPQAVIHAERTDLPRPLPRPTVCQDGECHAVGTTRDGDGEKRRGFETSERGKDGGELAECQGFACRTARQQPSRFFSAIAVSLIALPGWGKSWSSCANATQAFCFWLARPSAIPSFNSSSAALAPFG